MVYVTMAAKISVICDLHRNFTVFVVLLLIIYKFQITKLN